MLKSIRSGFPGWVQYGDYFNEHNTFWPYYHYWMDYKARVSAILQNSIPQSDIAILPPLEDMWSVLGQQRDPFPENIFPAYAHDLWQNLHQNGNGCDYVSEHILQQARITKGKLSFGPRTYQTLILLDVESLDPKTAVAIERFVKKEVRLFVSEKDRIKVLVLLIIRKSRLPFNLFSITCSKPIRIGLSIFRLQLYRRRNGLPRCRKN